MSEYRVGQVLYVVLRKEARVFPVQVVEEVTKRTLEGTATTYMIKAQVSDGDKVLPITDVDGEVFDSADKVRQTLTDRAVNGINQRVEQAVNKAKEWYPSGFEQASDDSLAVIRKPTTLAGAPAQRPAQVPPRVPIELAQLAAELRDETESMVIELPDGQKARVKSVKVPPSMQG